MMKLREDGFRVPYTAGNTLASVIWLSRIWLIFAVALLCWLGLFIARRYNIQEVAYWKRASVFAGGAAVYLAHYVFGRKVGRGRCRILFFRSFDKQTERNANAVVMPIIGFYGDLISLVGPHLERSRTLPILVTNQIMTDEARRIYVIPPADWKAIVKTELVRADIVVVDLSEPKVNVLREVHAALQQLPSYRVLFVCFHDGEPSRFLRAVDTILRRHGSALRMGEHSILKYGGSFFQKVHFAWALQQHMRRIRYQKWGGVDVASP